MNTLQNKLSKQLSVEFMSDSLIDGRTLRTFNAINNYSRAALAIDVDLSLPSERVIRSIEQIIQWRGKPSAIRSDNIPEYMTKVLVYMANCHQITLMQIQPGKPTQNAYIEKLNRTARHEWLELHDFESVDHALDLDALWLWMYNKKRPNTDIGGIPPRHFQMAAYTLLVLPVPNLQYTITIRKTDEGDTLTMCCLS